MNRFVNGLCGQQKCLMVNSLSDSPFTIYSKPIIYRKRLDMIIIPRWRWRIAIGKSILSAGNFRLLFRTSRLVWESVPVGEAKIILPSSHPDRNLQNCWGNDENLSLSLNFCRPKKKEGKDILMIISSLRSLTFNDVYRMGNLLRKINWCRLI